MQVREINSLSDCTQIWNYLNIHDFTDLILRILDTDNSSADGIFNAASLDTRPLKDFVEELHVLCGKKGRPVYGDPISRPEGPVQLIPDLTKTMQTFSWIPKISFVDGISEMLLDMEQHAAGGSMPVAVWEEHDL